ncbi:aminotransferase class V-fold PLP-dependent enzyme [Pedobacter sp. MC2016-15]|uniref:aminotransferase class V-fold PLP-dependent enzyme n=1 Tax=Pedobacter sp. MC2016-15 TaxID=2994473 RepID=UPI002245F9F6|nr:aminotransferase class V-fold PLP-dependent enzyme [Pedobacter sp. MC2016-15]MCX2479464.1 aminotransferase class V-fold PLP-dependent enzyme [Pedobacter sp. MC2016-15]
MKRRELVKSLAALPLAGGIIGSGLSAFAAEKPVAPIRDFFKELGVTPVINAAATMTFLSGSLMLPEVMDAINSTSHHFANMYELQDKVGAKIAEMLHVEAAMVTSGAACAMLLGTAACITGLDEQKIKMLPNFTGERPEVIIQKSHRYLFDQAITTTGAKFVEVESAEEMDKAFNANTVMALFFNAGEVGKNPISHEKFVELAKKHKVPSFIDAAADVPPVENLFRFQKIGFDLVTFSGGKMIRGPQSAGVLFGRKDLIEAARANHSPNEAPIGRPMKVNKEEMFGMYAALKAYIEKDHKKEWQDWLDRAARMNKALEAVPTVKSKTVIAPGPANAFPGLEVSWDQSKYKVTGEDVKTALKNGTPSIVINGNKNALHVGIVLLKPEEVDIVVNRVKEVLLKTV